MPSITEITVSQLSGLIGLPHSPTVIDVRNDKDFAADPRMIPGSQRRDFSTVAPRAVFLFVAPVADRFTAMPFDVADVFWGDRGDKCTFDVMIEEFGLDSDALIRQPRRP